VSVGWGGCFSILLGAVPDKLISANLAFLRFEALWVHAQTRHRLTGGAIDRWPGSRAAQRMQTQSPVALSARLLTQQLIVGRFRSLPAECDQVRAGLPARRRD
jgi:hypothetical protein